MLDAFVSAAGYMVGNPMSFLLIIFSVVWGIVFGAVPGLTGIVGVALLIPFTFAFDPTEGMLLLGGVYVGSTFGGSISAILFNTPGSPEAACTSLDGYPMAKRGEAGKALGIALAASAVGGIFGTLVLMSYDWDDKASWVRSMELFANELMPALNRAVGVPA